MDRKRRNPGFHYTVPVAAWLVACSNAAAPGAEAASPGDGAPNPSNGSTGDANGADVNNGNSMPGAGGTIPGVTTNGGAAADDNGTPPGAASGGATASGGSAAQGGPTGNGGVPITADPNLPPSRPQGVIPSNSYPVDLIDVPRDSWADGLISPTLESEHHNQPSVINGYLQLTGNARFSTYDIADPTAPRQLSVRVSPDNCATCGPALEGEAEGHQAGFAKYGDQLYTATISGLGIDIWNITNATDPQHLQSVHLEGINFGDFTEAIWGIYWQGTTIYVGGTNTGLHILDASDPTNVTLVNRLATSDFGGVSAGLVYAIGNILVVTTPKESGGIATLEISDPHNPIALDAIQTTASYIGSFYRHHLYLQSPLRVWDVLTDPTTIGSADAPLGTLETPPSEYMSFSDDYMFLGLLRPDPGAIKINVADPTQMQMTSRIWGRLNLDGNDDQFTVAVGNLLVLSDDQLLGDGSRAGSVIAVHAASPDTLPPSVDTIIPRDGATGQSTLSRVGISFTDSVELATVDPNSFVVRPVGGEAVPGTWGAFTTLLNFDPDVPLQPGTTYEVVLPAGRITDYVGNGIAEEFISTFTTR